MINQEEYEVLKELDGKWKWIARDGFKGELNVYNVRPTRSYFKNWWLTNKWFGRSKTILPYFFPFIQWTDSEPYFIPDLIKEYEDRGDIGYTSEEYAEYLSKFNEKLLTESEEKMKKDKEWLKDEVARIYDTRDYWSVDDLRDEILDSINELDEPEVLSQEWIDEYAQGDYDEWVYTEDLQSLFAPKQKEVKRAQIPEWIIEWYQGANNEFSTLEDVFSNLSHDTGYNIVGSEEFRSHIMKYGGFSKMYEALSHIYFGVYEIEEEEQLFYVYLGDGHFLVSEDDLKEPHAKIRHQEDRGFLNYNMIFTEQEIKDYDERYLAFKEQVEEAQNENP